MTMRAEQLMNLVDRAERGRLTEAEAERLRFLVQTQLRRLELVRQDAAALRAKVAELERVHEHCLPG